MVNEYKKIVLLKGLETVKDYEFRLIKSLLAKELRLTEKMQEDYDRINIANLMEEKFRSDAGLKKLISLCKDIPSLGELAETLEKLRLKVKRKSTGGKKSKVKKSKLDITSTSHCTSETNTDSEPESKEETPLLKEQEIKKFEDPERTQLPQEHSQLLEPSATTKQQKEGYSQIPPKPLPTLSSSFPIKQPSFMKSLPFTNEQEKSCPGLQMGQEMEDTVTKTHDNLKVQESQGQHQLPQLSETDTETAKVILHSLQKPPTVPCSRTLTPQMTPTSTSRIQTPQMTPASTSRIQTPQMTPASTSRIQTPQMTPASTSRIQTLQMTPASTSRIQTPQMTPASTSRTQTPQMTPASTSRIQTPQMTPTAPSSRIQAPPSRIQIPQMTPTAPSSRIQATQMTPTAPSTRIQATEMIPTSFSRIQIPQMTLAEPSSRIQAIHLPLTSTSTIQTPQMTPASTSRIQTPQMTPAEPSSRILTTHLPPTLSSSHQTPHMLPTEPSSIILISQGLPLIPSASLQTSQGPPTTPSTSPQTTPTSLSGRLPMNPGLTTIPKEASNECGLQRGPKQVMVLKATEPFMYELRNGGRKMFHATVATESEFFRVKVFNMDFKDKFDKGKVIIISDYVGRNGFLEIYSSSSVSDVSSDRRMEISKRLIQSANSTPKIDYLCSQSTGKFVNGVFTVHKINVRNECTYYEIQDNTGKMEVVVYGRLTYINCEEGDKLQLFCFELDFNGDKWQLRSVFHSYIKVIKTRKTKT